MLLPERSSLIRDPDIKQRQAQTNQTFCERLPPVLGRVEETQLPTQTITYHQYIDQTNLHCASLTTCQLQHQEKALCEKAEGNRIRALLVKRHKSPSPAWKFENTSLKWVTIHHAKEPRFAWERTTLVDPYMISIHLKPRASHARSASGFPSAPASEAKCKFCFIEARSEDWV